MIISGTRSTGSTTSTQQKYQVIAENERDTAKELGKDQFLELLVTQLRYQDPTNPVSDQEFLAQLAQFTSLEQINNLTDSINTFAATTQAASLLGKEVDVLDPDTEEVVSGVVTKVTFVDGTPQIYVGDKAYSITNVQAIRV